MSPLKQLLPVLTSFLVLLANFAFAQFTYVTNNGTITITGYTGPGGVVTIPDTINGLPVTTIGYNAFYADALTSVTIPNSVTSIEYLAFASCTSLTSVTIPNSVTNIGDTAFSSCISLSAITVDALNSVYSSMDGVLFNKSQTTLIQCPGAKTGSYPIPNSVTKIGDYAFLKCISLTAITVDALNPFYSSADGVLFDKSQITLLQCPAAKAGSYSIPNSVISIGDVAFYFCTSLTNVTIGNSVTSIGHSAFRNCTNLTSVTIPNSVTTIGDYAFSICPSLTNVSIGNSVISIGDSAFRYCPNLTSVTIPDGVTSIGDNTFASCTSMINVTIGNSVTSIGDSAFYKCTSLTSVTIPNSVTSIGYLVFESCTSLTNVTIGNSVTSIGDLAFVYCIKLTEVYFQGSAPSLGSAVFFDDDNATIYYLPGNTDWGSSFGDRPTAPWLLPQPLILNNGPSFGFQTNSFGFRISWASNAVVVVEASPTLINPIWSPVGTNTLTDGWSYFTDPNWTNYPSRFYRIRSP